MNSDTVEWFFGAAWLMAIIFMWMLFFGNPESMNPVFKEVTQGTAFTVGLVCAVAFGIVMSWVQFQRRMSQYSAVTDFVLPMKDDKQ